MKYTTIEGHEVKLYGYYEDRKGCKMKIIYCNNDLIAGVDISKHYFAWDMWDATGRIIIHKGTNIDAAGDLMRPWKEKEDHIAEAVKKVESDHIAEDGKLVVTDELVNLAQTAFDFASINAHPLQDRRGAIKTAMQTIFDHINNSEKSHITTKECFHDDVLQIELETVVKQILTTESLEKLQELTRLNFPEVEEMMYNTDNDVDYIHPPFLDEKDCPHNYRIRFELTNCIAYECPACGNVIEEKK